MASNMIGNLAVNLTMNTAAFQKGATLAEKRAATMKSKMEGVGASIAKIGGALALGAVAAGGAVLLGMAKSAFELGSSLTEAASKVGVTVEALQEMRFAATQNGISIETMDGSLNKMTRTLGELSLGNKTVAANFKELGLSARNFIGLTPTESFAKIADALKGIESETERAAIGNKIFGRSYAELKPLVDLGAAGINAAAEEKRKDGVISTEQAAKLDDLADGWDRLKEKVGVATAQFIANRAGSADASAGLDNMGEAIGRLIADFGKLLSWLDRATIRFHEFQRLLAERVRDSSLTNWIPGASENAQRQINLINAEIQRKTSGLSTGRVKGTGRNTRPSAGGALAGTMSGAGAGAVATLDKLEKKAAGVEARVAKPVKAALTKVQLAFKELQEDVEPLLDRLFPEVKALVDYKADQNNLAKWAAAGKISADKLRESLILLRDSYFGGDGPQSVTKESESALEKIDQQLSDYVHAAEDAADRTKNANVMIVKSYAETAQDVLGSISSLASSIKSGGFIGILEGVANLFLTLAGAGTFGKSLQTRVNAPGRARGGNTTSGRTYMVGEHGPELFTSNRSGYITPNSRMNGGSRETKVSIIPSQYFNVVVDGRADHRVAMGAPGIATAAASGVQNNIRQTQYRALP